MVSFFPFLLLGVFTPSGTETYEREEYEYGWRMAYFTLFLSVFW